MSFNLKTFGDVRLTDRNGNEVACPKLALVAMAYLLETGRDVPRTELAAMLWPDSLPEAALANLRSLLFRARQSFASHSDDPFLTAGDTVAIDAALVSCDFQWRPMGLSRLETLKWLKNVVATGFLRKYPVTHSSLACWVQTIEVRFRDHLRVEVLSGAVSPDREIWKMAREAAVYLLEADPNDDEVRSILDIRYKQFARVVDPAIDRAPSQFVNPVPPADAVTTGLQLSPRIALLPPASSSSDDMLRVLATALIEDVTIDLCGSRAFAVVAPYTSEKLSREPNKAEFLRQHNVSFALETRLSGETLFVQLIFCPTDEVVWADRLDLRPTELIRSKERLVAHISENVANSVIGNLAGHYSYLKKPDAYVEYLRGANELRALTLPAIRRARKHFRSAIQLNEDHAAAVSALARTLYMEWLVTARGDKGLLDEAARLAKDAIERDPEQSCGHRELGMTQIYLGNVDESLIALAEAERTSPHHADGLYSYGDTLVHASRAEDALVKLGSAIDHNPLPPDSYLWSAAGANYFLGRYSDAIEIINRMEDPSAADRIAAATYAMAGNMRQARLRHRRAMEANPGFDVMKWLGMVPFHDSAQKEHYREGLLKAGFK